MSLDREKAREVLADMAEDAAAGVLVDFGGWLDRLAECVTPDEGVPTHADGSLVTNVEWREAMYEVAFAEEQVAAVLALHTLDKDPDGEMHRCHECLSRWPCATARACGVTE